jgi:hypothetical protein
MISQEGGKILNNFFSRMVMIIQDLEKYIFKISSMLILRCSWAFDDKIIFEVPDDDIKHKTGSSFRRIGFFSAYKPVLF